MGAMVCGVKLWDAIGYRVELFGMKVRGVELLAIRGHGLGWGENI